MKRFHILFLMAFFALAINAQRSATYATADALLTEAKDLYQSGHFAASQHMLADFLESDVKDEAARDEAEFYYAANAYELRQKQAYKLLRAYAQEHTYSPMLSEVHFMQGVLFAEKKKFKPALKELDKAQSKDLFRQHVDACLFYKGYAFLNMRETKAALTFFKRLHAKEESEFYLQSRYYYAYCQYVLGDYTKALPDFLFVEQTDDYKDIAPYYVTQIYYAQKNYDEVEKRVNAMMQKNPDNENNSELYRIMGEIAYQRGDYATAITNLKKYQELASKQNTALIREDLYLLGMSCYQTNQFQEATEYLKKVKFQNDSLSQSTQYHLGNAYLKTINNTNKATILEQAKTCFASAMRMNYSPKLQEEAMYNYALTSYQSSSALGESVNAFMDFLNAYPNSEHTETVYALLSDAFMSSRNFEAAFEALNKIENPNKKMLETKQYLRYQMGADLFLQNKHNQAITFFDEVINNADDARLVGSRDNRTYKTEALYMKAESAFRLQKYDEAAAAIKEFSKQSNASTSQNYKLAQYLEGYIYFQQKQYKQAQSAFLTFLQMADKQSSTYPDALNRVGDCYFSQRDFTTAETYYKKVIESGASGADYAMFQRGYSLGLLKKHNDKITTLQQLVTRYPHSDYADDALYEMARAELQLNNSKAAITDYDKLLTNYPNSNMARKAALEKAMLYYNAHETEQAIQAYKFVIATYPTTDEAYAALDGLESCYLEENRVAEYIAYTKTLGKNNMQISSTKEDSLMYTAAELQYMQGNYAQAATGLKQYLDTYCDGGRYCMSAQYFCAEAYYQIGNKNAALREYAILCELRANPYMETALMRAAELTYDKEDYVSSLEYFRSLQAVASEKKNVDIARLGILRSSYYLGDNESTISVATELINDPATDAATIEEARYNRAKAYLAKAQYAKALDDFRPLAKEVRTAQGAESKYRVAECLFQQGDLTKAEEEVMAFAGMNTSQQYWLAKAFILLSDIYVRQGDDFMAEQYLLSLQSNYKNNDDIQSTIEQRLQLIRNRESMQAESEPALVSGEDEDYEL